MNDFSKESEIEKEEVDGRENQYNTSVLRYLLAANFVLLS